MIAWGRSIRVGIWDGYRIDVRKTILVICFARNRNRYRRMPTTTATAVVRSSTPTTRWATGRGRWTTASRPVTRWTNSGARWRNAPSSRVRSIRPGFRRVWSQASTTWSATVFRSLTRITGL